MIPMSMAASYALGANTAAAIAQLRGYDIHSDQVRTMILLCLIGEAAEAILRNAGIHIGNKVFKNLLSQIPGKALLEINKKIGFKLITMVRTIFDKKAIHRIGCHYKQSAPDG